MPTTKLGKCTWGWSEAGAVLSGAFGPKSAQQSRDDLAGELKRLGYAAPLLLTSRASVGLKIALEEMRARRPDRSVVVVPAYCCPSVPATVREAGLTLRAAPVAADLNLDLDKLEPVLGPDVLAVVGVHMYALPLDLGRLKAMADRAGAFVVDDAAHMVARHGDAPLGQGGDVGLLSFNQSKTLTGGSPRGGGALIVTNDELRPGIENRYAALPEGKARSRTYVWFALRYGMEIAPRALTEYIGDLDIPLSAVLHANDNRPERMNACAAQALCAQVEQLDFILDGRKEVVRNYLSSLKGRPALELVQTVAPRYLSRMLVRWKRGPAAPAVRERLMKKGFATRTPYPMWTDASDPTAAFVRAVNATHLEVPGSPHLTGDEIDEIVEALALVLAEAE
jgi:dTDP-4-amino-4,6-dideoxygalactose transaminase